MLQVRCKNINLTKSFPEGCSLVDVYKGFADDLKMPYPVVSAKVNNASQGLKYRLFHNRDVEFIDATDGSGQRVYVRSLCFVLYKAVSDIFPASKLFIEHPLARGYYCNFIKEGYDFIFILLYNSAFSTECFEHILMHSFFSGDSSAVVLG